ncbi:MAG: hypothetical protein K2W95_31695 [Candidatus Obscuribacterales bacterium]|nr:hypothetical protein [Candidatus Obscuribacterales bacterium]
MTKNIIILEDAVKLAQTWVDALCAKGHTVSAFIRVLSIADGKITGETRYNTGATVDLRTIDVAVCDHLLAYGKLIGGNLTGGECVPSFLEAGIPCVSTSSGGDITLGKGIHIDKEFVLDRLDEIAGLPRHVA